MASVQQVQVSGHIRPDWFLSIAASPAINIWSGVGDIEYEGQVFHGDGTLGTFEPVVTTSGLQPSIVNMEISALDSRRNLSLLGATRKPTRAVLAARVRVLDSTPVDDTLVKIFIGFVDRVEILQKQATRIAVITLTDSVYAAQRNHSVSYYDEFCQSLIDPQDTGFTEIYTVAREMALWRKSVGSEADE